MRRSLLMCILWTTWIIYNIFIENNLQIMPPLTISQELLDEGLEILISVLRKN
jgi:4-aminobutyrate aminotransferase-like enzyme